MEPREVCWDLPAEAEFVGKARAMVRETLVEWGLAALVDDVELIVSELYANAVVHGEPEITLTLRACGGALAGAVTDHGAHTPRLLAFGLQEEHGRGLGIVGALANRWGVDPLAQGGGKTVWFILRTG